MSETEGVPQLTGEMFLFERPELLSKDAHGKLGFKEPESRWGFCSHARGVPITAAEVPAAMKNFPIIIVNHENPALIAALGLIDEVNLFVDDQGKWENNTYVPGYIRRYPFGVASEDNGERFAVVVDRAFAGLVEGGEVSLFENGVPTENTQRALDFVQRYEAERAATQKFCARLKELDLLQAQNANFTPEGESKPTPFAEYIGINEEKLAALDDKVIGELHREGYLALIFAMLMSLGNWPMLVNRRAQRFDLRGADALKPLPKN